MAKTAGSISNGAINVPTSGRVKSGGGNLGRALGASKSLSEMKHQDTAKVVMSAINKVYKEYGLETTNIRVAPLNGAYGATYFGADGKPDLILLDEKFFDRPKTKVARIYKQDNYTGGKNRHKNRTSYPVGHTITHEIGHSLWSSYGKDPKSQAMGKELRKVYQEYKKDAKKKGYGKYSHQSVDEFYAEVFTSSMHQNREDKYTKAVKSITKKYR